MNCSGQTTGTRRKTTRGRVYSVVYCIRCIVYTLYSCIRCIRRRQAGTVRVRSIAVVTAISLYRALYGRGASEAMLYNVVRAALSRHAPAHERLEADPGLLLASARCKRRLLLNLLVTISVAISLFMAGCTCPGLRVQDVEPQSRQAFQKLCQVTTGDWGDLSAEVLFKLCREVRKDNEDAVAAVQDLFHTSGVNEAADLYMSAASTYASFGKLAHEDESKAIALHVAAQSVSKHFLGLYQGKAARDPCHALELERVAAPVLHLPMALLAQPMVPFLVLLGPLRLQLLALQPCQGQHAAVGCDRSSSSRR